LTDVNIPVMCFSGKQNNIVFYPPMYMFRNLKNDRASRKKLSQITDLDEG